jgi:outer membrane biosynthesis protein TonB
MSEEPSYRAFETKVRAAIDELVADVRRQAEADAENIRRAAASEAAGMLAETERRRNELLGEIQRLERQLAQVSTGIQALLQGQLADAARAAAPPVLARPAPELPATPPLVTPSPPPPREEAVAAAPEPEPVPPAPEPPPPPSPPMRQRPIDPPRAVAAEPLPPPTAAPEAAAEAAQRTEVAVSGTPSFARALELQRGIQRTPGVRHVQALQFERGTLVLAVEHDAGVDLAEAVRGLPNVQLELRGQTGERLEFAFA